jgi:hypothetical protein
MTVPDEDYAAVSGEWLGGDPRLLAVVGELRGCSKSGRRYAPGGHPACRPERATDWIRV